MASKDTEIHDIQIAGQKALAEVTDLSKVCLLRNVEHCKVCAIDDLLNKTSELRREAYR